MDVRVFGPLQAIVDGRPVPLGGVKPRALLAMLALNAGSTVSSERLIEGLWGGHEPATATKLVQVYVSQLRKALAAGGDGTEIVTRGRGYELRLGSGDVDARRFERLIAQAAPRDALALWHGPPLDDVAGEPFAAAEIRRLEELRLGALELAIERDLAARAAARPPPPPATRGADRSAVSWDPGLSLYSRTCTRSFSKVTSYLSGSVCVGSLCVDA